MTHLDPAFFQAAVAASGEAILITGAATDDHPVVYADAAFLEMTGYDIEELIGRNPRILQGGKTDSVVLDGVRRTFSLDQGFTGETVKYRKDGSPYRVS